LHAIVQDEAGACVSVGGNFDLQDCISIGLSYGNARLFMLYKNMLFNLGAYMVI
jgi:hypothetical protein